MGLAMGGQVSRTLAANGVIIAGVRWLWYPGWKGGIFEPHWRRDHARVFNPNGFVGDNAAEWGAMPGEGVNWRYCQCQHAWILRGTDGRWLGEKDEPR